MNPVFWFLVLLGAVGLWACLNIIFSKVGEIVLDMFKDVKRSLKVKEEE